MNHAHSSTATGFFNSLLEHDEAFPKSRASSPLNSPDCQQSTDGFAGNSGIGARKSSPKFATNTDQSQNDERQRAQGAQTSCRYPLCHGHFGEMWKKLDFYARVLGDWTW
jgi:hypothetical protein